MPLSLRHALRSLMRAPLFAVTSSLSLALGIGAATSVFAIINALVFAPLPYPEPERLLDVWATSSPRETRARDYLAGRRLDTWPTLEFRTLEGLAFETETSLSLGRGERSISVPAGVVEGPYFQILGIGAKAGRVLVPNDGQRSAPPAAVLSDKAWRDHFDAEESAVGATAVLSGRSFTVVGVMPEDFEPATKVWVPRGVFPEGSRPTGGLGITRVREGVSTEVAILEIQQRAAAEVAADSALYGGRGATASPLGDRARSSWRSTLGVALGVVAAVYLIVLTNLTSLFLIRANERSRSIAVRAALGANRWNLGRSLLLEASLIALTGALGGMLLAVWGKDLVLVLLGSLTVPTTPRLDLRVFGFALALATLAMAAVGMEPLRRLKDLRIRALLQRGSSAITSEPGERRMRNGIVAVQVALALVLVSSAIVLVRAHIRYVKIDVGYDAGSVVVGLFDFEAVQFDRAAQRDFATRLLERMEAHPQLDAATSWELYGRTFPPQPEAALQLEGRSTVSPGSPDLFRHYGVGPRFFETMGLQITEGRSFGDQDVAAASPVAVITADAADLWWPGDDAVGKRIRLGEGSEWITIVGVSENAAGLWSLGRFWTLIPNRKEVHLYRPLAQTEVLPAGWARGRGGVFDMDIVIATRARNEARAASTAFREVLSTYASSPQVRYIGTMQEQQMSAFGAAQLRTNRVLVSIAGGVGLAIALLGILGVVGDAVVRRTREIGIRMALGASGRHVIISVTTDSAWACGIGTLLGFFGLLAFESLVTRLFLPLPIVQGFDLSSSDWRVLMITGALILATSVSVSLVAAWKATRVDVVQALMVD